MKKLTIALSILICIVSTPTEAELSTGIEAYRNEEYAAAFKELKEPAQKGNSISQFLLGVLYRNGYGVKQSDSLALEWFLKAAKNGNADAMEEVATAYAVGAGVSPNFHIAFDWLISGAQIKGYSYFSQPPKHEATFEKGTKEYAAFVERLRSFETDTRKKAERGEVDAQVKLGYLYLTFQASAIEGVESDFTQAYGWWLNAAKKSDIRAQVLLADSYLLGLVVNRDKKQAEKWLLEAANKGNANAQLKLARLYGFKSDLLSAAATDIPVNVPLAIEWAEKASAQGMLEAQSVLGTLLIQSGTNEKGIARAVGLLTKASDAGLMEASLMLGDLFSSGNSVPRDYVKAITFYQKPWVSDKYSSSRVARMYELGLGVPMDKLRAIQLYEVAAKNDIGAPIHKKLASLYESLPHSDPSKAFQHYVTAGIAGDLESMRRLETAYRKGELGQSIDETKAQVWTERIAQTIKTKK